MLKYLNTAAFRIGFFLFVTTSTLCQANSEKIAGNFAFTDTINEYQIGIFVDNKNHKDCGLSVSFGDGTYARDILNLEDAEIGPVQFTYKHRFPDSKGYLVQAKGITVPGGFFTSELPACEMISSSSFWVPIQNGEAKGAFEFLMVARNEKTFLAKNIDGSLSFRPSDGYRGRLCLALAPYSFVSSRQEKIEDDWLSMSKVLASVFPSDSTKEALTEEAKSVLKKMGWNGSIETYCGFSSDIIAVPTTFKNNLISKLNLQNAVSLFSIDFQTIQISSQKIANEAAAAKKAIQQINDEYIGQANAGNKEWIGSLFLGLDRETPQGELRYCSVNYSQEESGLFLSYLDFDIDALAKSAMLQDVNAHLPRARQEWRKPKRANAEKTFKDLNSLYIAINSDRNCNLIVDYPENLVQIKNALVRDNKHTSAYGKLIPIVAVKDRYAAGFGFSNNQDYVFAKNAGLTPAQILKLKKFGVGTQPEYEKIINDVLQSGYSRNSEPTTVFFYLQDYADASNNKISVLKQKAQRLERERLAREEQRREEEKRLEAFAQEYPYQAIFTCGFNNDHINILACFSGGGSGVDTELELRNGSSYRLLKPWEIGSLGQDSYRVGFTVPLRSTFGIKAQNSSDNLILGLKIINTKTNATVFEKSVGHYGVIRVTN